MAKALKTLIKLQIMGGAANPAPPVGPALGQHGLNIAEFCQKFNDATSDRRGEVVPVEISVYEDNSYDFKLKTAPASELLKKLTKVKKGSGKPHIEKVGTVTQEQLREIAQIKMPDLNTNDLEQAVKIIAGTAKQMGLVVKE